MRRTLRPDLASPAPISKRVRIAPVMLMIVAGCGKSPASKLHPVANPMQTPVANSAENPIDYSQWRPSAEPKRISLGEFSACLVFPEERAIRESLDLHWVPMIKVFANPVAYDSVAKRHEVPLPAGSVIVKEKWLTRRVPGQFGYELDESGPGAYAAMIKREAGYDQEFGDWEYVYVTHGEDSRVERGHLTNCRACHSKASSTDYLFLPNRESESQP